MSIEYNDLESEQQRAFDKAAEAKHGTTRIVGYAGTGKTTVMAAVAKELGAECAVLSPTNKAALNLVDNGIKKARTIHSLLYSPVEVEVMKRDENDDIVYHVDQDTGEYLKDDHGDKIPIVLEKKLDFGLREVSGLPKIALVDEASMVTDEILADLEEAFDSVVLFGDGFQLPPVGRNVKSALDIADPDIALTEIHRVAEANPIIRYATDIRNGIEPDIKSFGDCHEIKTCTWTNKHLYDSVVKHECQAIAWRNKTRHAINENIRKQMGYEINTLNKGEPIVINQNVREDDKEGNRVLIYYNGQIVTSLGDYKMTDDHLTGIFLELDDGMDQAESKRMRRAWPFWNEGFFFLKDRYSDWNTEIQRRKAKGAQRVVWGTDMDYAYCLTAHKAQGSEFKNVAVFDERSSLRSVPTKEKQRWYYTAITRAKERVLVIR